MKTLLLMYPPRPDHLTALMSAAPNARFLVAADEQDAQVKIADADAVLGNRYFLQSLPNATRLRWMQSNSMGLDLVLTGRDRLKGITITCARGVYDDEVADHAAALVLALVRGLHHARDQQHAGAWHRTALPLMRDLHVLIMGWGGIGQGIARRLTAFGATCAAVRRTHTGSPALDFPGVRVYGLDQWRSLLPTTNVLILALPLTEQTRGLIDAAVLAALPRGSLVVNVARGGIVDEPALFAALAEGHIGGAGLDVLDIEPPPADHPVWRAPNVLLTPHVGRSPESGVFRWEALFVENVRRFAAGEPLLNRVDPEIGY